jgi:hypothetical protein
MLELDYMFNGKIPYVMVEQEWIPVRDTIFLNISEDLFGQDVYEFKYKGKVYSSHVVLRYDPKNEQTNL